MTVQQGKKLKRKVLYVFNDIIICATPHDKKVGSLFSAPVHSLVILIILIAPMVAQALSEAVE